MGASWLEIESLLKSLEEVTSFSHAEALLPVTRARDTVAEAAMIVSRAAFSSDPKQEAFVHDALARARVTVREAEVAVRRAEEAVKLSRSGCDRARQLIEEARQLRARDNGSAMSRPVDAPLAPPVPVDAPPAPPVPLTAIPQSR